MVPTSATPHAASTPTIWFPTWPQWPSSPPTGVPVPKIGLTTWRANTGEQCANRSARAVHAKCVERVIVTEHGFQLRHHTIAKHSRDETDAQRRHWVNKSRRRCNRHQPGHRSRNRPQCADAAIFEPLGQAPASRRRCRSEMRGHKRAAGQAARRQRAACVEPEPSDPQETRSDKAQHQAMWWHRLFRIADALSHVERAHQRGNTGGDVHHGASGKIQRRESSAQRCVQESAFAPDHMRHGRVHDQEPQCHEQAGAGKFHAFRSGPCNQRGRDHREHQLVNHERQVRNCGGVIRVWS